MGLRWAGFRRVRRQVCRRIGRRLREIGLPDIATYRAHLESAPDEWRHLDSLCHVTISRLYRDRAVFEFLEGHVLPELARRATERGDAIEAWSVGCASGEEPYSLVLAWESSVASAVPGVALHVRATDADEAMVERARRAAYQGSSLRDLPATWHGRAFVHRGGSYYLRPRFRKPVTVELHDIRASGPLEAYDLVLCRNMAFTYFDLPLQREVAERLALALRPGGALVIGSHETLPNAAALLAPWCARLGVFRRSS
jgi:chemotaxis protein methyltransferase CheR